MIKFFHKENFPLCCLAYGVQQFNPFRVRGNTHAEFLVTSHFEFSQLNKNNVIANCILKAMRFLSTARKEKLLP